MQQLARTSVLLLIPLAFSISGCSNKATGPTTAQPFSLQVKVSDVNGTSVSGLRVDAWNVLSPPLSPPVLPGRPEPATTIPVPTEFKLHPVYPNPFEGSMSTEFDLPVACSYDFRVTDLIGREVYFWSRSGVPAGRETVVLGPSVAQLTVYAIEVVAYDSTGVFFTDTTFGAAWTPVPTRNTMGHTDLNGELLTDDSLHFPVLFDAPEMPLTDPSGTLMGTFEYVDSVQIILTDSNSREQSFVQPLRQGRNEYRLLWQP